LIQETRIVKGINELKQYRREMPSLARMNITNLENSVVCCRLCRGTRLIATESSVFHSYTFKKCPVCLGSGTMSSRESDWDNE
jgi:hypothetical protein